MLLIASILGITLHRDQKPLISEKDLNKSLRWNIYFLTQLIELLFYGGVQFSNILNFVEALLISYSLLEMLKDWNDLGIWSAHCWIYIMFSQIMNPASCSAERQISKENMMGHVCRCECHIVQLHSFCFALFNGQIATLLVHSDY